MPDSPAPGDGDAVRAEVERVVYPPIEAPPTGLRTRTLVWWGMAAWALALVVILVVPDLRTGERDWWPWVPACALALGVIGLTYLGRGRGNASDA